MAALDREDFEGTTEGSSAWPFGADEFHDDVHAAFRLLETYDSGNSMAWGRSSDDVLEDWVWLFSRPTHLGRHWRRLAQHPNVQLLADVHATSLTAAGGVAEGVQAVDLTSSRATDLFVRAQSIVLAAGGLESVRLLLDLDQQAPGLILGRRHLGLHYFSHISGSTPTIEVAPTVPRGYLVTSQGTYARPAWRLDPAMRRKTGLPNIRANVDLPPSGDPAHGSGILSAFQLAKMVLKRRVPPEYATSGATSALRGHVTNVVRDAPSVAMESFDFAKRRFLSARELPSLTPSPNSTRISLHFDAEQVPDAASFLSLDQEVDRFGLAHLRVNYGVGANNVAGAAAGLELLLNHLATRGELISRPDPDGILAAISESAVGSHHFGGARMAQTPDLGVVDSRGSVFGCPNLYVAAPAAFPSSGVANPTLPAVAWSLRVARGVAANCRRGEPVRIEG